MKPRILHIDNSPAVTGAYRALLSWCLSATEFEHIWVLPEGTTVLAEVKAHFTVYTLPFVEIGRSPAKLIGYLPALILNGRRLAKIIQRESVDMVHANDLYNLTPYAAFLFGKRLPLIVHARMLRRSFPGRIYDFWKQLHMKYADNVIAVSEAIRRDWNDNPRVTVIYDPIAVTEQLQPYHFIKKEQKPFRFLYLANYISGKGQDDALAVINSLKAMGTDGFEVDFYGGTLNLEKNELYKQQIQRYVSENGLSDRVRIGDAVVDLEATMKKYHALLHFSHSESFGMVCYEALYYGLPVISTQCGGPEEMIVDGVSGILVPLRDLNAYGAAMSDFVAHPEQCADLSVNARAHIIQKFSFERSGINQIFKQISLSS